MQGGFNNKIIFRFSDLFSVSRFLNASAKPFFPCI